MEKGSTYGSIYSSFRFLPISDGDRKMEAVPRMAEANANEKLRFSRGIWDAFGGPGGRRSRDFGACTWTKLVPRSGEFSEGKRIPPS